MRKSTAQKDLAGHTKQFVGQMWPTGHGLGSPGLMAMKTIICLSFIVLNNFFAHISVKKIVPHQPKASPHVTAMWSLVKLQNEWYAHFLLSVVFVLFLLLKYLLS